MCAGRERLIAIYLSEDQSFRETALVLDILSRTVESCHGRVLRMDDAHNVTELFSRFSSMSG